VELPLRISTNKKTVKPERPAKAWKLAFVRKGSIWIANGDGTNQHKLIADAEAPCWSPDKTEIVFARQGDVWLAKADGTRQRPLTHRWNWSPAKMASVRGYEGGRDIDISWGRIDNLIDFSHWEQFSVVREGSKTGKMIPSCAIYEVPTDKPTDEDLTPRFDILDDEARFHASVNSHPAWSRDGNRFAFVRNGDIWIANRVDYHTGEPTWKWTHRTASSWGWDVKRLAAVASYDAPTWHGSRENAFVTHLTWSPDGKSLVYGQRRINGSGYRNLYLLHISDADGEITAQRDPYDLDDGEDPCFSPDGRFIAYFGGVQGQYSWGVLAKTLDGKTVVPLIEDGEQPAW
jgi:Tol biopolymer transport system component